PYVLELRAAVVEIAAVGAVVQVEAPGEQTGLDGLEHPAVGFGETLGEDPGVHGFQDRLAGGLAGVVPAGEPGRVQPEPGVLDEGSDAGGERGGHLDEVDGESGSGEVVDESGDGGRVDAAGRGVEVPPQFERVAFDDLQQGAFDRVVETLPGGDA